MAVCAVASGLPCPFLDSVHLFAAFIWFVLFFGGMILPPLTGIMLNTVNEYHRAQANSIS